MQSYDTEREFDELSITTIEGLRDFIRHVANQFQHSVVQGLPAFKKRELETAFTQIENRVEQLIERLQCGEVTTARDAAALQSLYDQFMGVWEQKPAGTALEVPTNHPDMTSVSFTPVTVEAAQKTPLVKRAIRRLLHPVQLSTDVVVPGSLTREYVTSPPYRRYIKERHGSFDQFDRILSAEITAIEAETIDPIERWFDDVPASAFWFVKDMAVTELFAFAEQPYEQIRSRLQEQNIKYETFVAWRDLVDEVMTYSPELKKMSVGELFVYVVIEDRLVNHR